MAIYHLEAKVISRGIGRSAVAAAAYMSCSKLYNDYDGIEHDYTRKHGLIHEEIFLPPQAPPEWREREKLWNAVEEAEKAKDSRLAREFVLALPVELSQEEWIELMRRYITEHFTSDGMCADLSIHDTDGHNPHAHLLLTVRPLNDNGTWQNKTEKEYLCMRGGKERGFTASEYKKAQADGWEKQYQYKIGKKKVYMIPSEAERSGYERASKYPKSMKYGRQNPISERWNSDEQLVLWREAWADTVNQLLEEKGIDGRIDHRSFKAQGLTEQPTIHEGISARIMEKKGFQSDKCELNRMIKADNQLLRRLKAELLEIANAVKNSIPKIAKTMETIFTNLIVSRYNQSCAQRIIGECKEWLKEVKPASEKYLALKKQIKAKSALLKEMKEERKTTSALNVPKMLNLTKEITTLTEEIEELKNALHDVYFYYHTEDNFKEYCAEIPAWEERRQKHEALYATLDKRIKEQTGEFLSLKGSVAPDEETALQAEREALHSGSIEQARELLQSYHKGKFDHALFADAKRHISDELFETERDLSIHQHMEQAKEKSRAQKCENKQTEHKRNRHQI